MAWLVKLSDESILNIHAYCQLCCKKEGDTKESETEEDTPGIADSLPVVFFSTT